MKTMGMLVLLSLCGGYAAAQPPADSDGDGAVSQQEFLAAQAERAQRRFSEMDTDGDGMLTRAELADRWARRGPMRDFGRVDTDGDGAVSLSELQAVRPELTVEQFNRLDANGDGLLGADERPGPPFRGRRSRY